MNIFDYVKHFSKNDAWGDWQKMYPILVFALDFIQEDLGKQYQIKLHCGWAKAGHASNSWHYKGHAEDFHIEGCSFEIAVPKLLASINKLGAPVGFGIYPWWKNKGFHLDIGRPVPAYWISASATEYRYYSTKENLLTELKL